MTTWHSVCVRNSLCCYFDRIVLSSNFVAFQAAEARDDNETEEDTPVRYSIPDYAANRLVSNTGLVLYVLAFVVLYSASS